MKKLLIATAAMAVVAGAQAQSSVSVYGVLDVNYTSADTTEASTFQSAGGLTTSRLGFKGTEDLGSGNKAEFQLETKLVPGTGVAGASTDSKFFNRESWVGLSSATLGSVRVGFTDVTDTANIDANVSQAGNLALITGTNSNDSKQVIRYTTPTFAGLSAQVGYANPGSSSTTTGEVTNDRVKSVYAQYVAGNLGVYAGQDSRQITATYDQKQSVYGAKYNFGFATVGATYSVADGSAANTETTDEVKSTRVSIVVPVAALGKGVAIHGVYAKDKTGDRGTATSTGALNAAGSTVYDNKAYTLALTKALSPRTTSYVAYKDTNNTDSANADSKAYIVGVRHTF